MRARLLLGAEGRPSNWHWFQEQVEGRAPENARRGQLVNPSIDLIDVATQHALCKGHCRQPVVVVHVSVMVVASILAIGNQQLTLRAIGMLLNRQHPTRPAETFFAMNSTACH